MSINESLIRQAKKLFPITSSKKLILIIPRTPASLKTLKAMRQSRIDAGLVTPAQMKRWIAHEGNFLPRTIQNEDTKMSKKKHSRKVIDRGRRIEVNT